MRRDYQRLSPLEFAEHLLTSGDLDPVYIALNASGFDSGQKLRWLVAYIAFYHCGAASWLSERKGASFWEAMAVAAQNTDLAPTGGRWPRGHERRHFRGHTADVAIAEWAAMHSEPETMMPAIAPERGMLVARVMTNAQRYYSVGSWLAFKIADLADACMDRQVNQSDVAPFLYKTPLDSLVAMFEQRAGCAVDGDKRAAAVLQAAWLANELRKHTIPHKPCEPLDWFVIETIACKYASHLSGHYPLHNDIVDIASGLMDWAPVSQAAAQFMAAMPKMPEFRLC